MSQHGPTWGQLKANMDLKIIEKPLFFLGFFDILRKSLKALGNALGDSLGMPWGGLGYAWEGLGDALGGLGGAFGAPWEAFGDAKGTQPEGPARKSQKECQGGQKGGLPVALPRST